MGRRRLCLARPGLVVQRRSLHLERDLHSVCRPHGSTLLTHRCLERAGLRRKQGGGGRRSRASEVCSRDAMAPSTKGAAGPLAEVEGGGWRWRVEDSAMWMSVAGVTHLAGKPRRARTLLGARLDGALRARLRD